MRENGQLRLIAQSVSVCEKGIILQSQRERGELYPSSNGHTKEITVQLCTMIVNQCSPPAEGTVAHNVCLRLGGGGLIVCLHIRVCFCMSTKREVLR